MRPGPLLFSALLAALAAPLAAATGPAALPRALDSYTDPAGAGLWDVLAGRAAADPLNLAALLIFGAAILHTFLTAKIRHLAHVVEERHAARLGKAAASAGEDQPAEVKIGRAHV